MNEKEIIKSLGDFFAKAPALPASWREFLVRVAPWFALIFGILGILGGLGLVGLSPLALVGGVHNSVFVLLSGILDIVASVLLLVAYPKLRARKYEGWRFLFWSEAVSVLATLVAGNILSAIVAFLIGFYLLYQIKSYYK